ncbi:hypothetical protein [Sphingomonas montanisoli]|uniref:XRE family transcriptional regulator n=1 Tax=Sphingomonas montanisoli TaxID=2606412 RepID=A0A5D9C2K2_9SPHN|nr:hypothetical protein [Sphingomonas montanisoli]TZG25954.1 hypothetical protein FYJ91_13340 [Sphingomonas montanisoli]
MLPKTGSKLPKSEKLLTDGQLSELVGRALRAELGTSGHAAKIVMRWTGVSDRCARAWIHGETPPRGANLIELARNSNEVAMLVLMLINRNDVILAADIHAAEVALARAAGALARFRLENARRRDHF